MKMNQLSLGPLGTNCYIAEQDRQALVIDPGGDGEYLLQWLEEKQLTPAGILLTHAHFDHIGAIDVVRERYDIPVYLHQKEADWLEDPYKNGSLVFTDNPVQTGKADHFLEAGEMQLGPFRFEVTETPGHSPGSVSFIFHDTFQVVAGDTLFQKGAGRTDLPGGDQDELQDSVEMKLFTLDGKFTVYPGHGPTTTIAYEKENNPFFGA